MSQVDFGLWHMLSSNVPSSAPAHLSVCPVERVRNKLWYLHQRPVQQLQSVPPICGVQTADTPSVIVRGIPLNAFAAAAVP